jgi:hypothetical protein
MFAYSCHPPAITHRIGALTTTSGACSKYGLYDANEQLLGMATQGHCYM